MLHRCGTNRFVTNIICTQRSFSTFYTKDHEWISISDKQATIGISDHAQSQLGDVVFIEFSDIIDEISFGDVISTIESVKAVSDVYSPVDCKILEFNEELLNTPEIINESPETDGWLIKVEITEIDKKNLLSKEEYLKYIE